MGITKIQSLTMFEVYNVALLTMSFLSGSAVKNPPAIQKTQEMRVQSLGHEGLLEEGMATHSVSWAPVSSISLELIQMNYFSWLSNIPWCIYVPQLPYPFVCWWASRLLPCPGYCKQYCDEHWGACVSFRSDFLHVYAQKWDCWVIWQLYFQFFKKSPHCSP